MVCPITWGDHNKRQDENIYGLPYYVGGHKEETTGQKYNGLPYSIGRHNTTKTQQSSATRATVMNGLHVSRYVAGVYSLSVLNVDRTSVKHYRIRELQTGGCYISPRQRCDSVPQLIKHYSRQYRHLRVEPRTV